MVNDSLTKFANTLYAEAIEEKTKVQKRLEEEREEALAECDARLEERFEREMKKFRSATENERRLTLSRREVELMTELRRIRQSAADEVIDKTEKKLREFTKGEEYTKYLIKEAEVTEMFTSGTTVCYANECDFEILKRIIKVDNIDFEKANGDIIGGFVLRNSELGLLADCTLKSRLEERKELFLEISGLVIG